MRQFLGTGSPNTVTRLLENWWQDLGKRLEAVQQNVSLPDAPPAVADLASRPWEQAAAAATATAHEEVNVQRQSLEVGRAELAQEGAALRQRVDDASRIAAKAVADPAEASVRLQDLQRLAEQQDLQVVDLVRQRDEPASRAEQAQIEA